jgi:hypothetical protein
VAPNPRWREAPAASGQRRASCQPSPGRRMLGRLSGIAMHHTDGLRVWFEETAPEPWFRKEEAFDAYTAAAILCSINSRANVPRHPRARFRATPRLCVLRKRRSTRVSIARPPRAPGCSSICRLNTPKDCAAHARCIALLAQLSHPQRVKCAEAHKAAIDCFGQLSPSQCDPGPKFDGAGNGVSGRAGEFPLRPGLLTSARRG